MREPGPARSLFFTRLPLIGNLGRQFLLSALVGVGAGVGAVGFYLLLQLSLTVFQRGLLGYASPEVLGEPAVFHLTPGVMPRWLFFLVPALGGLLSGLIVWKFAPEAQGHGTDAAIDAYHQKGGHIRSRVPLVKAVTAAVLIGSGGSGGREGPIAQIGAGIGSWLGRALDLDPIERRTLTAAGMGAGVGAIFRAPLAGALFAGEILYNTSQIEHQVLVPAVIASVTAYSIFSSVFGWQPLFRVPDMAFTNPLELILYSVLALAVAGAGILFVRTFYGFESLCRRLPGPRWLHPAIGGLLTGSMAFFLPGAAFTGYGEVQEALLGHYSALPLLVLAGFRILTTSFSIGSGGSGGVFGPSMVIGGCLGGALGMLFYQTWPQLVTNPASFTIVGMAGFFAGIAHAPISTVIMVSEMTGSYQLLVPSLWVCTLSFLLTSRYSLYRKQVSTWNDSQAHRHDVLGLLLEGTDVAAHMHRDVPVVGLDTDLDTAHRISDSTLLPFLPVVDVFHRVVGIVPRRAIATALHGPGGGTRKRLQDLVERSPKKVASNAPLSEAHSLLVDWAGEGLVVVDPVSHEEVVGVITRDDVYGASLRELEVRLQTGSFTDGGREPENAPDRTRCSDERSLGD
ncbi:MAG: chloride channel protein [Candidatus Riflebacteria bacterium]|nr:chloride channel protein [Candidatus Riflebacteria bacterium]